MTNRTDVDTRPDREWDVTLLTDSRYVAPPQPGDWYVEQIYKEEGLIAEHLVSRGLHVNRVDWADPEFDFRTTRCAVFRSTWDYFDRAPEFATWLDFVEPQTTLINNVSIIRWNMDKHYLADLEKAGVEIVQTLFFDRGTQADIAAVAKANTWDEIVLKPAISGAARLTFRAAGEQIAQLQSTFDECVGQEDMLIQPFQPEIVTQGELSLIVIGGRFTHAIRKTARMGDFRVQDDHGGAVHAYAAAPEEISFAEKTVAACPEMPIYARVDLVRTVFGCRLMELELVEPELFFRFHPPAAVNMADAIAAELERTNCVSCGR